MPPKRGREHHARQAHNSIIALTSDIIAKRTKRHLDELERSNYAEPSAHVGEEDEEGKYTKGRARQLISEKRAFNIPGVKKKKSTMNVRTALLYRKKFCHSPRGIEPLEFPCDSAHVSYGPSSTADIPPAANLFHLWLLGELQVSTLCIAFLRSQLRERAY
ncbi:Zinc finger HIT domain-containing protein 1 [Mycena sanguinolenta]|uniref:Zinc finger HIT domain-containing protein 1 n=1 Tax=Mycena sanguinolenta TaxID=230812 RepID=A0A8H7DH39_9AGAR|nr:Zinc finger HIT domain-containing protein 1 [Mycena sanguinolenta]